jgi:hypothetical protein
MLFAIISGWGYVQFFAWSGTKDSILFAANIPTVPALRNYILYSDLADEFSLNEIYDSV